MTKLGDAWSMVKETFSDWSDDNASRLAAALAYYTLLSLAPLLVIAISVAGWFFGLDAARGKIQNELVTLVGPSGAEGIQSVIANARSPSSGIVSTVIGVVTLFIGASGVFGELQGALDTVWEVQPKPGRGLIGQVRDRFLSFTMVLGVAFLLLVSLVLSIALSAVGGAFASALPGGEVIWHVVNAAFSFALITGLFALIFKYIPDADVKWNDVWLGAAVTSALFTLGKIGLGIYLGRAALSSSYGAAGSLVALVVWVYYAAQILFVGAEFTQVQARRRGREIQPSKNAVRIKTETHTVSHAGTG
ncbi:MAG TPA: YihY/virulence factor BrkB family protein [Polyangiaceae bacterium]|jgi:membrane protein|nr:YihY/virulence factor BrkB family protein [Polyangiaceae bacterium]